MRDRGVSTVLVVSVLFSGKLVSCVPASWCLVFRQAGVLFSGMLVSYFQSCWCLAFRQAGVLFQVCWVKRQERWSYCGSDLPEIPATLCCRTGPVGTLTPPSETSSTSCTTCNVWTSSRPSRTFLFSHL